MRQPGQKFFLLFAVVLLFVGATPRQTSDIPRIQGESIEVSIVNVDVFVTDKQGNRVHGLTKNDFELLEDKKPQPITNFAEYAGAPSTAANDGRMSVEPNAASPAAAPAATAPPQKRTVVVFIERFNLPRFRLDTFFGGLKDLLHQTIRPGDKAMVIYYDTGLAVTQQFTDDHAALDRALDAIEEENAKPRPSTYEQALNDEADFQRFAKEVAAAVGAAGPPPDLGAHHARLDEDATRDLFDMRRKLRALNSVVAAISGAEGRKVLILGASQFSEYAGAENYYLMSGAGGPIDGEFRAKFSTRPYVEEFTHNANAHGVNVYPLYPPGLGQYVNSAQITDAPTFGESMRSSTSSLVLANETNLMVEVAKNTGGATAWGPENIVQLLPSVRDDFESYYSLAYRTTTARPDKARNVVVRTKNPNYVVRSRREYVEKTDDARMRDIVVANLYSLAGGSVIGIGVKTGALKQKGPRFQIPLSIQIPIAALTIVEQHGVYAGQFSVYVTSSNSRGAVNSIVQRTQRYTIPAAELAKAKEGHFTYDVELDADLQTRDLSVAVYDEVSREYGLARADIGSQIRTASVDAR